MIPSLHQLVNYIQNYFEGCLACLSLPSLINLSTTWIEKLKIQPEKLNILHSGLSLLLSVSMTFGFLFFVGKVIFGEVDEVLFWFSVTALSFAGLRVTVRKAITFQ